MRKKKLTNRDYMAVCAHSEYCAYDGSYHCDCPYFDGASRPEKCSDCVYRPSMEKVKRVKR